MKIKETIKVVFNFVFFRSIVYLLSFISYNTELFSLKKWLIILEKRELILLTEKILKYKIELIVFTIIISLIFGGYSFLRNKISEARENNIRITTIKKKEPENLILYIGAYLLPSLGAYYKLSLLWLIIYEVFLFIIYCRHINFHYKILLGFLFHSYVIEVEGGKAYTLYTRKKMSNIDEILENKITVKFLDFSFDYWEDDLLFLNEWHY